MEKETKVIEDKCPRCAGTGADPDQSRVPRRVADDPISGERRFQVSADLCRQCGGTGRMPKRK
jgi:DnaJ-class molecular chaperone